MKKSELIKQKKKLEEQMENVDNELNSIDELPNYEINTGLTGTNTIEIPNVKGKLDCIIVDVENKIDMIVESALGYLIVKRNDIIGTNYLAPRIRVVPTEDDLRDRLTFTQFNLDEKLIITVMGPKNSNVKIVIRLN